MTVESVETLEIGDRVTVGGDADHPYVKVDEEWMESSDGVRIRVKHFAGEVAAGRVEVYDPMALRPWVVRRGAQHYSVLLEAESDGVWRCFTFTATHPERKYQAGVARVAVSTLGDEVIEDPPWREFFTALAGEYTAAIEGHKTAVAGWNTRVLQLEADLAQVREQNKAAARLRDQLRSFLED